MVPSRHIDTGFRRLVLIDQGRPIDGEHWYWGASSPSNWTPTPVVRGGITTGPANITCHDLVERYGVAVLPDVRPSSGTVC